LASTGDYRSAPNAIRLTWLAQLASQLASLHDKGVVHGGVRPAGVQLLPLTAEDRFPAVKLDPPPPPAASTTTPADATRVLYMHPGLLDGSITVPTRDTDVYALGVTAWHVLSGVPPFGAAFPDGLAAYDAPTARVLLSAYLARVPDAQALPPSPLLWHEHDATDLHRLWSARDRGGVTARSLVASLLRLAMCADRAGGSRCSVGWVPGHALSLIVAVQDTAMARARSCVVAVEADDEFRVVKREVERATGYLVEEQHMSLPGSGAVLLDDATVAGAGLRHADAVTVTVGGKYGITVTVYREAGVREAELALEVAGGDMLDDAVLRPIAVRYGSSAGSWPSVYHEKQSCMLRDPTTTTVRQHAIRPGSRLHVIGPTLREAPATIFITLRDGGGESLMFKVRPTTKMEKVMETYASKRGVSRELLTFIFEGGYMDSDLTVGEYNLSDGDEIIVRFEMAGD